MVPVFSYWNNNLEKWPEWASGAEVRVDSTHLITLANQEIERIARTVSPPFEAVGAPLFFGLTRPVYAQRLDAAFPCDAVLCRSAKQASPRCVIDVDKTLWPENVVGAAMALFDSAQLCHNHYHRDATLRMGWGMIGPDFESQNSNWDGSEMLYRTDLVYYHWLNCGFRIAASGGSAIGVMPVPSGDSRTYAKFQGPLTQDNYLQAIRDGRTFATTGPMLVLTVDGQDVGATIHRSSQGSSPLRVRAELNSIQRIEAMELIHNGQILERMVLSDVRGSPVLSRVLETRLSPKRSGWIVSRALFRRADGTLHQAHTSPVYIKVDDKPIAFRSDAEYMIRWIDRILEVSRQPARYKSEQDRSDTQAIFGEARLIYERIAADGKAGVE